MTDFYCVISNRDILKIHKGTPEEIRVKIWKFMEPSPTHFLTSLAYVQKGVAMPDAHRRFFDCGAWSYKFEVLPTFTPEQCKDLYLKIAHPGDLVAAPDHMVLTMHDKEEEKRRIAITLDNAGAFMKALADTDLTPLAVVHGNSISIRVEMVHRLLDLGYTHLALGGLAGRAGTHRKWILELVETIVQLKQTHGFYLHVLGISALSWVRHWLALGVDSYDGSSMFFEAFTASKFYVFDPTHPDLIRKIVIKGIDPSTVPECECLACLSMRAQNIDTRQMGSNENNMGRAVHNVNIYQRALAHLQNLPVSELIQGGSNNQLELPIQSSDPSD